MGWFDEQIKQRKINDDKMFEESLMRIADAVTGDHVSDRFHDDMALTRRALSEILGFYQIRMPDIPDNIADMEGQLEYVTRPYGMMYRSVKLADGWYKDASGAMLGIRTDTGTAIALIPDKWGRYTYWDNQTGKKEVIKKRNAGLISGEAICFYKPLPMHKIGIRTFINYSFHTFSKADAAVVVFAALMITLLGMLTPKFNRILFSDVVESSNMRLLGSVAVFMLSAKVATIFIRTFKDLCMAGLEKKIDLNVRVAAMMRVLCLPPDFFKSYSSGELAERVEYLNLISKTVTEALLNTGVTSIFSLLYIFQIFLYAPGMTGAAIAVLVITIIFLLLSSLVQTRLAEKQMQLEAGETGMIYAVINGIQKIRLSGAEKRVFSRWADLYAQKAELTYSPPLIIKWNSAINTLISAGGVIILYFAALSSHVSTPDYYAFYSAYGMTSSAFTSLVSIALQFAYLKPVLKMIHPVLEAEPEVSGDKKIVSGISGGLELSHISFRYRESLPMVIDDLSLKIKPGQYLAVVGATGCGKSTLLRLIMGFEKPQKGAIYYDGKDLNSIDLRSLRKKIGVVLQNGKLFQGSIYSNIVIGAPWLSEEDAWEAAEIAGIAEDIREMPMGMHTMISEGSGGISGGQKQRLMIARAVVTKPKILILDEATSALDNITQRQVSDALEKLQCTRIVVAHRLSTIQQCDRIIMLEDGKIIEDGTYDELIKLDGKFGELVARQRVDKNYMTQRGSK